MKAARILSVSAVLAALAGCTVGPDYHRPEMKVPGSFAAAPTTEPSTVASVTAPPIDVTRWWRTFNDPELDSLIDRAIAANLDIEIALARVQEAREQETVIEGGSLPYVNASGGAARGSGTNSTKGRVSAPLNAGTNTTGLKEITGVVGFDAGWELDIWGKYTREIEAAKADTRAMEEIRNGVLITVVSDVARAYMDTRTEQLRLAILRDNIKSEQTTVDIVQQRVDLGIVNELDLALAKRELATLQAQVAPMESEITISRRRLAVLLGEYPEDLTAELAPVEKLPDLPGGVEPGLPIELLRRRPDIREAERELEANNAQIGAAIGNLFPNVAVTAGAGLQGQGLGRSNPSNSFIWSAGPLAEWPLLDFGALDAQIQIQKLRTHEALVNYKQTILSAVEETDDAIASFSAEQERLQNLGDALAASERAVDLAQARYNRGIIDFLNVADAERQLYTLQDEYALSKEAVIVQFIAIYKSLGGGWEDYQFLPAPPKPQPAIIVTFQEGLGPKDAEK
jgi:NodT family efflux transporter outer membrane factor (OMF) lipoprotein